MTTAPNRPAPAAPDEAELIRDARALIAGVEKGISYVGALFALATAATIAALKADLRIIAEATALIGLVAFAAVLLGVLFRITLGDPPQDPAGCPRQVPAGPREVVEPPTTGSAATTPRNRMIPRK